MTVRKRSGFSLLEGAFAPAACRISHWGALVMTGLTAALVAAICFGPISSPDFWWQLAEGQQMLATGRLTSEPLRAFGLPSTPFVNEYVLYEVLLAAGYSAAGMIGLRFLLGSRTGWGLR
jgi:hypothetical protein